MELGQRLRQARLEAGLSQRQLCGDVITRNMLSQIENGSARPSMDTLRYLAGMLGRPMGYFLEEEAVTSPNRQIMEQVRQAFEQGNYEMARTLLEDYQTPDPVFDNERYFVGALVRLALAEKAIEQGKGAYAETLLAQAAEDGARTPYYNRENEGRRLTLLYTARPDKGRELGRLLPADPERTLLLAAAHPERAGLILDADPQDSPRWHYMRAEVYFEAGMFKQALGHYEKAPQTRQTLEKLEICCRELEDFKTAYFYACKLREM